MDKKISPLRFCSGRATVEVSVCVLMLVLEKIRLFDLATVLRF